MTVFELFMLSLGQVTGGLHEPEQRQQLIALLRSKEGERTAGYLNLLRESIGEVLQESGREEGQP